MLALLALIHLFAIAGLVGYLFASGRLNAERVNQMAMVLRGEFPKPQPASQPASAPAPPEPSRAEIERLRSQREYYELVAERHQRELDDRRRVNQTIQLNVSREMEAIERQKAELAERIRKLAEQSGQDGFAQVVEMYSSMDPVKAKELLYRSSISRNSVVEAATILSRMDENRSKKIFNACKTPGELEWVQRILAQIQQSSVTGAGVDGPKPASTGG